MGVLRLFLALWCAAQLVIGYLVLPVAFATLDSPVQAGALAARLLSAVGGWGVVVTVAALLAMRVARRPLLVVQPRPWLPAALLAVAGLIALALVGVLQPSMAQLKVEALPLAVMDSPFADAFSWRHRLSTALYGVQSLAALVLMAMLTSCRADAVPPPRISGDV